MPARIKPALSLCLGVCLTTPAVFAEPADPDPAPPPQPVAVTPAQVYNEAVKILPDWWKFNVEIRGREDTFIDTSAKAGNLDSYYMSRVRLSSTFTIRPWLRVFTQAQDSRTTDYYTEPAPASVHDSMDLRQAYVELGVPGEGHWSARLGRQPLAFGDLRLIATSNWSNVGPAFDSARVSYTRPAVRLDWFSGFAVVPSFAFDRPRSDKGFSGFYSAFDWAKNETFEAYALWKSNSNAVDESKRSGYLDVYTYGTRSVGRLPDQFDYNLEFALQRGHVVQDPMAAWLGHIEIGRRWGTAKEKPRTWIEYNSASGDHNPLDNRRGTFEQLYPAAWTLVGRAADLAYRNLNEALLGFEWKAGRKWKLRATERALWLADKQDSLYLLSGSVFARDPTASSNRVGTETGAWAMYQMSPHLQLWGGYAQLFAGPFLREAGKNASIKYPFFVWTYSL